MVDPIEKQRLNSFKHWIERHGMMTAREVPDWELIGKQFDVSGRQVKRWYDGETAIPLQLEIVMMTYDLIKLKAEHEQHQNMSAKARKDNPKVVPMLEFGEQTLLDHITQMEKRIVKAMQRSGSVPFWIPTDGKDKA